MKDTHLTLQMPDGSACMTVYMELILSNQRKAEVRDMTQQEVKKVIKYVRKFLDEHIPIHGTSWKNISNLIVNNGNLIIYKDEKFLD